MFDVSMEKLAGRKNEKKKFVKMMQGEMRDVLRCGIRNIGVK